MHTATLRMKFNQGENIINEQMHGRIVRRVGISCDSRGSHFPRSIGTELDSTVEAVVAHGLLHRSVGSPRPNQPVLHCIAIAPTPMDPDDAMHSGPNTERRDGPRNGPSSYEQKCALTFRFEIFWIKLHKSIPAVDHPFAQQRTISDSARVRRVRTHACRQAACC